MFSKIDLIRRALFWKIGWKKRYLEQNFKAMLFTEKFEKSL
jgi:hypothetical protein